ncbi:MAG: crotonase/enoyl-CoA hydratase family protein [Bacteroidota bacterium]
MSQIHTEVRNHILYIGLNRPEKYNAFSLAMLDGLSDAFTRLDEDPELRVALLYGTGDHFTSGLDLGEVGPAVAGNQRGLFDPQKINPLRTEGRQTNKPVVMAVQGYCYTIGMELVLANDICVAHQDTQFGQIEIKRGIFPFGGGTFRMPQRVGWGNAMRYLLTGDSFDGREAYRIGMIQEITEENPFDRAEAICQTIAAQAPLGVQESIRSARLAMEKGEQAAIDELLPRARWIMQTEDAAEGLHSFLERRQAKFRGK